MYEKLIFIVKEIDNAYICNYLRMKTIILAILITVITCAETTMITFDTPENFILTPAMYYYADSFIIEMWSAGGCPCGCGYAGGGSGSYIKALIYTDQKNFSMCIGNGGYIPLSTMNFCPLTYDYANGGNTSLHNDVINLIAGGGYKYSNSSGGKIFSLTSNNHQNIIYEKFNGTNGGVNCLCLYSGGDCDFRQSCDGCNGGSTPYGGSGSISGSYLNGSQPGGGGGGVCRDVNHNCPSDGFCNNMNPGSGGDGKIILYLTPQIFTSTPTPTQIFTQTSSSTISSNTTITTATSPTTFISSSPSISSSPTTSISSSDTTIISISSSPTTSISSSDTTSISSSSLIILLLELIIIITMIFVLLLIIIISLIIYCKKIICCNITKINKKKINNFFM